MAGDSVEMTKNGGSTAVTVNKGEEDEKKTSGEGKDGSKGGAGFGSSKVFLLCFVVSQLLALLSVILVIAWCQKYLGGFDWGRTREEAFKMFNFHPLFLIIGLVIINGEAALLYRVFPSARRHQRVKWVHAGLQLVAFVLVVIGLQAEWELKDVLGVPDMYSLHSWLGLGAVLAFAIQLTLGLVLFLLCAAQCPSNLRGQTLRDLYLPLHRFCGAAILLLSCAATLMGITTKFFISDNLRTTYHTFGETHMVGNVLGLCLTLYSMLVAYLLVNEQFSPANRAGAAEGEQEAGGNTKSNGDVEEVHSKGQA